MGIYFGGFPGIYREPGRAEGKGCGIIWFDCRSSGMTKREEFFNIKTKNISLSKSNIVIPFTAFFLNPSTAPDSRSLLRRKTGRASQLPIIW